MATVRIRIYPIAWETGVVARESGVAGSSSRAAYLRFDGPDVALYERHADGTGVDAGLDPVNYESDLSGFTSLAATHAAGYISAATRGANMATALLTQGWVSSATVSGSDETDGARILTVSGTWDHVRTGTRDRDNAGDAGSHGSDVFRRSNVAVVAGYLDIEITRNICSRMTAPPASAQFSSISLALGDTVSTTNANRPRVYFRHGSASTTIPGATVLADLGQFPTSQIVAGEVATIYFTPAVAQSLRTALTGLSGELWACLKSTATTEYAGYPTGGGWAGDMQDTNVRVDVATSADPTTAAPAAWNNSGALNFAFIIPVKLHYQIDPANDGGLYVPDGTLRPISDFVDAVSLPDTETGSMLFDAGHRGLQLHSLTFRIDGRYRMEVFQGATLTNPDAPTIGGITTLYDWGVINATGEQTLLAPTGDSAVYMPSTVTGVRFKGFEGGTGATGYGLLDPELDNTAVQVNGFIRRGPTTGTVGDATTEFDLNPGAGTGDPDNAFIQTPATAITYPDNLPGIQMVFRAQPFQVETVIDLTAGSFRFVSQAPTITVGAVTVDVASSSLRLASQASTTDAGTASVQAAPGSLRFASQSVTLSIGTAAILASAGSLRFASQAPTLTRGAVSLLAGVGSFRFVSQSPTVELVPPAISNTSVRIRTSGNTVRWRP